MNWTILMSYTMSHICIVLPHIRNLIKTPEDWLITFLRIKYSVSVSQIPARWWHGWACVRPVPRSVAGIAHCGRTQSHTVANTVAHCGGTAVAHSGEHWWHTVVGSRLGPNVPSASSLPLLSFYSLPLSPICQLQASMVSGVPKIWIKQKSDVCRDKQSSQKRN